MEFEVAEKVQTGLFVGDCFVYTTHSMRLNYVVGGKVTTLHHLGALWFRQRKPRASVFY